MTNLTEYGKGRSPSEIQYEPGAELVEELERKIAKLKELLKECRYILETEKNFPSCRFEKDTFVKLLAKINKVLK